MFVVTLMVRLSVCQTVCVSDSLCVCQTCSGTRVQQAPRAPSREAWRHRQGWRPAGAAPWGGRPPSACGENAASGPDRSATAGGGAQVGGRSRVADPRPQDPRPALLAASLFSSDPEPCTAHPALSPRGAGPPAEWVLPVPAGALPAAVTVTGGLEAGDLPCASLSVSDAVCSRRQSDPAPAESGRGTPTLALLWVWNQARNTEAACNLPSSLTACPLCSPLARVTTRKEY